MENDRKLSPEEYADLAGRILYEDNHLLIVNKKVGEITQGDKTGDECLADLYKAFIAIRDHKPGRVFLGVPHRLDRPVSGICVLAKTSKALERLAALFRSGDMHKTYWALCCAKPEPAEALLEDSLWRDERQNKTFVARHPRPDAKLARLRYRLAGATERYYGVEVSLLTGRHHQIRCQLASRGWPIKGDLKYGASRSNPDGGICLHAREIRFVHPVRKEELCVTAPLPDSWKGLAAAAFPLG